MRRYQAYAWNGTKYRVISVPLRSIDKARKNAIDILTRHEPESELEGAVIANWTKKPIIVKSVDIE